MAEKIVSPGVFTNEIDQSFLPAAVADIGAVVIGPTVKGPALSPTVVTSFSDFQNKFGDAFKSGSNHLQFLTSHAAEQYLQNSNTLTVVRILDGDFGPAEATVQTASYDGVFADGANVLPGSAFKLVTLADGALMNNSSSLYSGDAGLGEKIQNNILLSGSKHNIRWEVSNVNNDKGTFTLLVRRGDDSHKRKQVLESFSNVNLDPKSNNFIAKAVGDQRQTLVLDENDNPFLQLSGSYTNKSKYVRVTDITSTVDYLDENGDVRVPAFSASLPASGSGSYGGSFNGGLVGYSGFDALGNHLKNTAAGVFSVADQDPANFYENISAGNSQGLKLDAVGETGQSSYIDALDLLSNQDEFDVNLILVPGVIGSVHTSVASKVIDVCEDRGDCFAILDPVEYGKNVVDATTQAETRDSNYAAMYWPWIKVPDNQTGTQRWVPPSVALGGIYAFNDKVAHPWFAPAGLNRGGIDTAIQAERKLTQADRDSLYDSNVNPIATFPGQGVTVFGQKTLQKKSSALDRINVRRLLIKVKKFIASSSRFLVFEQNTAATRRRFLGIVNPYLENVQSQSGLNAFRVVMDETNNTPDTIDRNQLIGQLFLQPTRTAEFIVLDFTIQPTGASFPE